MIDKSQKHHLLFTNIVSLQKMHSSVTTTLLSLFFILCFNGATMVHSQDTFNLPSPLPKWPPGEGFASGIIDLGGLQVSHVTTFNKIWATNEGGPDNLGATLYDPIAIPQGFSSLGSYVQPNNIPLFGHILVGKDISNDPSKPTLKSPIDYTLLWSSESLDIKKDGEGYIWLPIAPEGYKAVGYVVSGSSTKPPLDKVSCVRADFTDTTYKTSVVLENENDLYLNGLNTYHSVGGFVVGNGSVATLKGSLANSMPNLDQIKALIQTYSPVIYFHPDEQYLPSSVDWFFQNGALLYHKGDESKPNRVDTNGLNLPQGGSNDDTYWLDLPLDGSSKDRVKKGDLQDACAYFHVKPMSGGLFTDIAIWVFYPFNGGSRAKVKFLTLSLGKLGEHVGDWEHVTLRVSNINGELNSVFFSQHSWGKWVSASALEYHTGNKPVVYASLHGHASYPKPGCVLLGSGGSDIGIRDDTAKSDKVMDTGVRAVVIAAEYLAATIVVEPPWLNYERKWGPKIDYDVDKEVKKVKSVLMWRLKKAFERLVKSVPRELLGEDGPTGPKAKTSWSGDEGV
ncbi:putative vacuolar protein sorting-associated protein [Helianthus annuus]|nr:putative vacuolar protein sorting-associated protein [Helianthus annuus]